jgi:hypothetical protein
MSFASKVFLWVYLAMGFILMGMGVVLSPRPGTIPFISIVCIAVAFLLFGKFCALCLMGSSAGHKSAVVTALR